MNDECMGYGLRLWKYQCRVDRFAPGDVHLKMQVRAGVAGVTRIADRTDLLSLFYFLSFRDGPRVQVGVEITSRSRFQPDLFSGIIAIRHLGDRTIGNRQYGRAARGRYINPLM